MKAVILILHAFRDLIVRYLPRMRKKGGFAFIVHPPNISYVYRKYAFAKYLPEKTLEFFLKLFWPVILSEITGLYSKKCGQSIKGYLLTIPLTTKQMLQNRKLAEKKILQAIKLSEKTGAVLVGLDALNSYATRGGLDLLDKTKIAITNGRSLTAGVACEAVKQILNKQQKDFQDARVAVIGATELVGEAISKLLARENIGFLILVGKTLSHLEELKNKIAEQKTKTSVKYTNEIEEIKNADIIIVATASPNIFIKSEYLKHSAVIYDASPPQNVSPDILNERPDITLLGGSLISTPGINYHFNFGIPKEVAFSCLTETMLLAAEKIEYNYSIGEIELNKVDEIKNLAQKYNFNLYLNNLKI